MRNKLVLTLWLVGAVLYAGSTAFLAHAVLGVGSSAAPADKVKAATVAAATDAKCEKDSVASADAKPAKHTGADPQKTAAIERKKPAPAPSAAKPASPDTAKRDTAKPGPAAGAAQQKVEDQQDQVLGPDGASIPDGWQDQEAMGPDAGEGTAGEDEWANVVAGTADMRSEPSMQAPLVYALPAGWQVRVISRKPGWVQVQDANSGAAGWVESSAIAPASERRGPSADPSYGGYDHRYGPYDRYADEGYPSGAPPPPWRGRSYGNEFGDFFRRALGGF
jgi:Bacterial SH3 domain